MPLKPQTVIIVAGSVVTAAGGFTAATFGAVRTRQARSMIKRNADRYQQRHDEHLQRIEETNQVLISLGNNQERALYDVIFRMRDFLKRHKKLVKAHEHLILDGLDPTNARVVGLKKLDQDVATWVQGVIGSVSVGFAAPVALRAAAGHFAAASTGTAISSLTGAAATKATLAWFGGGSLAAGGGGMALGATVLNVAIAGPTVLLAGLTVMNGGTQALTRAEEHLTEVDTSIADLDLRDQKLAGVQLRSREIEAILMRLMEDASSLMDELDSESFDPSFHTKLLQRAIFAVAAVRELSTSPIADEQGNLNESTFNLIVKHRSPARERTDEQR